MAGTHEAIIDYETFDKVQGLLQRDTRTSPNEEMVLPLAGVVFCADCGRAMCRRSVARGNRKFYYYVCSTNKRGRGCSSHSFEQGKLETTVLHALTNQINMIVEMEQLMEEIGQSNIWNVKITRLDRMIAQKENEADGYRDFRMKLYEALREELIDRDEYAKMRQKYTQSIEEAEAAIQKLKEERSALLASTGVDCGWIEQFVKYREISELTREVVVTLIDRIYIYEDKHIKIDFNYRDEIAYYQEILKTTAKEVG